MSVYFSSVPAAAPLAFHSLGVDWAQAPVERPDGFPHYHYLFCQQGKGVFRVCGRDHVLQPGQGILIAPRLAHSYYGVTDNWTTAFATFCGSISGGIRSIAGGRDVVLTPAEEGQAILSVMRAGMELIHQPGSIREQSLCCYGLLLHMTDGLRHRDVEREPLYIQYVAPVVKEIETNFHTRLTVEELSERVFVSPQYLTRLFRRFLGCGTYEYINARRMDYARQLLLDQPHLPIWKVAQDCGFDNASHFISLFKRSAGLTPAHFRAQYAL
ncbi:MAG: helix-turn-helix domain-containing protein [Oscillospiraceae bacterium]|nr:helix-turn-helix domain-containing protein [Oscillospiraceae bacterium]